ncbi:MAG: NAD-dependent epimerase/dehydratase family protein [Verrucomicrobiae bacterium]|nr:NAD-dependent epimerase/dehydratase family protein [Verrucomicrobiae bacterium]
MNVPHPPIVLLGASGEIGSSIREAARTLGMPVQNWGWKELLGAGLNAEKDPFNGWLKEKTAPLGPCTVVFAQGLTNSRLSPEELMFSNCDSVRRIVGGLADRSAVRFLTLGTVSEHFAGLCAGNPYLSSKLALGQWMEDQAHGAPDRFRHLRLHTIYGGAPKPHMFLGQMLDALRHRREFRMSPGLQLREYHHCAEIARIILEMVRTPWNGPAVRDLSSGEPVRLCDLAGGVFGHFDGMSLLKVGALPAPAGENTQTRFPASPEFTWKKYPDPVTGICKTFETIL